MNTLAEEAVIATWPLYEMRRMRAATSPRRQLPRHQQAGEETGAAPPGQRWCNLFSHARQLLGAGKSRVVTPNCDTLYTTAWLHVQDALVLDVPDSAGRYYVLGLLDFYTNPFAHIGQRLTGTAPRRFLITAPGWRGTVPAEFRAPGAHICAPTPWLWVIGRILVDGAHDLAAAHAVQDGFALRRLTDHGTEEAARAFAPDCDPAAPLSARHYAAQVNAALRDNPPLPQEAAQFARFATVGLGPDAQPDAHQCAALDAAITTVQEKLRGSGNSALNGKAPSATGWSMPPHVEGCFASDPPGQWFRARIAHQYIGMLDSREAVYPLAWHDSRGQPLHGAARYQLRFAAHQLPPVDAFWSITLYDAHTCMLADNPLQRHALGDRTPGLEFDADGALSLHIQHQPPAQVNNWLPAPPGPFYLCLRAYIPQAAWFDGRYQLPAIEKLP